MTALSLPPRTFYKQAIMLHMMQHLVLPTLVLLLAAVHSNVVPHVEAYHFSWPNLKGEYI